MPRDAALTPSAADEHAAIAAAAHTYTLMAVAHITGFYAANARVDRRAVWAAALASAGLVLAGLLAFDGFDALAALLLAGGLGYVAHWLHEGRSTPLHAEQTLRARYHFPEYHVHTEPAEDGLRVSLIGAYVLGSATRPAYHAETVYERVIAHDSDHQAAIAAFTQAGEDAQVEAERLVRAALR